MMSGLAVYHNFNIEPRTERSAPAPMLRSIVTGFCITLLTDVKISRSVSNHACRF